MIGEKLSEMEVLTTHDRVKLPDHFRGEWLVLFSHPADFTPVCTTEFVALSKRRGDFKRLNAELLGLSVGSGFSHMKWAEEKFRVEVPFRQ